VLGGNVCCPVGAANFVRPQQRADDVGLALTRDDLHLDEVRHTPSLALARRRTSDTNVPGRCTARAFTLPQTRRGRIREMREALFQTRPARDDDRLPLALLFAAVAEERDGIATEPPVDIEARAASWTIDGTLVAVAGAELIGSLVVEPSRHGFGEIGMAVAREWRGRGVGSALLAAAIEWAHDRGLHKLSLGVFAHNTAAIELYRKFGFVEEGRRIKQYRRANGELWDAIEMGLLL
jgi:RimJ/RimL family protein N-acetyltransferase